MSCLLSVAARRLTRYRPALDKVYKWDILTERDLVRRVASRRVSLHCASRACVSELYVRLSWPVPRRCDAFAVSCVFCCFFSMRMRSALFARLVLSASSWLQRARRLACSPFGSDACRA